MKKKLTAYWAKFYSDTHCTLCGNSGVIDTRGVKTAAGTPVGRKNYCICPNGQALRNLKAPIAEGEVMNRTEHLMVCGAEEALAIKREVMLRDALYGMVAEFNSGDVNDGELAAIKNGEEALAATADLSSYILCHAEPAATGLFDYFGECHAVERNPKAAMGPGQLGRSKAPLYRAWEPKP